MVAGCEGERNMNYRSKPKNMKKKKKKHPTVRSNEIRTKINHSLRMKTKRAIKTENGEGRRGGRPCHDCDPREGVPVLYHAQVRSFYLYSTVMFGISFEGEVNMSHCFPWLPFDWLSMLHALKCQQLIALFV